MSEIDPVAGGTQADGHPPLLVMCDVRKSFAAGEVLHGVDFDLERGEIHALVGQNGAGKSTLMKVLGGVFPDYSGRIAIDGVDIRLPSPRIALDHGIAVIYQDFALVADLSVADNIGLGREPAGRLPGSVDHAALRARSAEEAAELDIALPMDQPVRRLGVAEQQLAEVVKAISRRARILVMDEPTARLSPSERDRLFRTMRSLKAAGVGIVYISHFLEEVFVVADRVTVLRDGNVVITAQTSDLDLAALARYMVGAQLTTIERAEERTVREGTPAIELRDFAVSHRPPVTLSVQPGEIVGMAGLVGSGRTRFAEAIVGHVRASGQRIVDGRPATFHTPADAAALGILLLPEDRKRNGLVMPSAVASNLSLTALRPVLSRLGFIRRVARRLLVADLVARFGILPADPARPVRTLSGGNQQKVLMARAFGARARVLILDQPTAGVDVGAKAELYGQIRALAREGVAVVLISDDLDELLLLADRIVVMRAGRADAPLPAAAFSRAGLLEAITRQQAEVAV